MADGRGSRARYRRIMRFAGRYMVQEWWYELVLARIGLAGFVARTRARRIQLIARHFHGLAVDLGGLMIKVGQFLSSRLDVLPPEITGELAGLQDEVPAAPIERIRALAEADLGIPLARAYASFESEPLAAASLGQVHRARLTPEEAADTGFADVVVKVQRPGIEEIVEVDLAALRGVARRLSRVAIIRQRVDLPELVEEFAIASRHEIDYLHEAANAERFREAFRDDPRVRLPEIAWERTTRRVLTMSDVGAIKINDVEALREAGIDPAAVATAFAQAMFEQLFVHGYFHADPHPGNIFVTPLPRGRDAATPDWALTFVDFGMMGEISDTLRAGLRRALIAVAARDGKGLVQSIQDVGALLPTADTFALENAMTALFARFGGMGFADLQRVDPNEFRDFAEEFGDVMRAMPFQLPEDFLLIIRAISLTSGVCSSLDPEFNIWSAVEPFAARLLSEEGRGAVRDLAQRVGTTARIVAALPERLDRLMDRVERGQLTVDMRSMERRITTLERLAGRVIAVVIFAGMLVAGGVMRSADLVFGTVLMVSSLLPLGYALFGGLFRRRG